MRRSVTIHGRDHLPPMAPSVIALWRVVRGHPTLLFPVARAVAYAPDGDLELAYDLVRGYDDSAAAFEALAHFFTAKDGPLEKRRGDFVELLVWDLGPFRIGRKGGALRRHHEAVLASGDQQLCSPDQRVDVVFHVQDRTECVECKVNVTRWSAGSAQSARTLRKLAHLRCLNHVSEDLGGGAAPPPRACRWWVGLVSLEDHPLPLEGLEVLGIHALSGFMALG